MTGVTAASNIRVSAFLRGGKPLELLELARAGQIELSVSDPILDETARVLKDKFHVVEEDVRGGTAAELSAMRRYSGSSPARRRCSRRQVAKSRAPCR